MSTRTRWITHHSLASLAWLLAACGADDGSPREMSTDAAQETASDMTAEQGSASGTPSDTAAEQNATGDRDMAAEQATPTEQDMTAEQVTTEEDTPAEQDTAAEQNTPDENVDGELTMGPGEFNPDYETSSEFFTRIEQPMPSNIHAMQRTWYSSNLAQLPLTGPFTVPEGSVAVKAEYDADRDNFTTVVMIKREAGYDPEGNDWYYEVRNPDGSQADSPAPDRVALCSGCHKDGADTDFLLGFDLEN